MATDPYERFLVGVRGPDHLLVETATGSIRQLPHAEVVTPRARRRLVGGPAARVTFGTLGRHVAYVRVRDGRPWIAVRRLDDGTEADIDPGPGDVRHFGFEPGERSLVMHVEKPGAARGGGGPVVVVSGDFVWQYPPTEGVVVRIAPSTGGAVQDARPGHVVALGTSTLERRTDGSLWRIFVDGTAEEIVPLACAGRVRWGDPTRERILMDCRDGSVHLCSTKERKTVAYVRTPRTFDDLAWQTDPLLRLQDSDPVIFFDTESERVFTLAPDEGLLAVHGRKILFERGRRLWLRDAGSGQERAVANAPDRMSVSYPARQVVAVGNVLLDLESERVLGVRDGPTLAISSKGEVLIAAEIFVGGAALPLGPLWWQSASATTAR